MLYAYLLDVRRRPVHQSLPAELCHLQYSHLVSFSRQRQLAAKRYV